MLQQRIQTIQSSHATEEEWQELKELQLRVKVLWKQEEVYWNQRSRIKWLKWGDNNSRFFHASTLQRRDFNRILKIRDAEGIWVEGQKKVNEAAINYFKDIYSSSSIQHLRECFAPIPKLVTDRLNHKLCAQVSMVEIKEAVFSLGDLKAPGIDGLNGLFYQQNWEIVKNDVSNAILAFFEHGDLPLDLNETLVTLIPKIPHPEAIQQFRPISCVSFIYKVISKIFVARLKSDMANLISPMQSGFIQGRQIQDNLIIVQEAFHAIKKPGPIGRNHVIVKLDINKAYDRMEWDFLRETLLAFGFAPLWVNRIMVLITGASFRYKINGVVGDKLTPSRGLRQGDPISPYLFLFVMEALSLLLQKSGSDGKLQGIKLAPHCPPLTHLLFADDAILFARAESPELFELKRVLNLFSKASGQRINLQKSGLIGGRDLGVTGSSLWRGSLGFKSGITRGCT